MNPPLKPDDSECCGSGCTPCIFDIYEEQLKKYENKSSEPQTSTEENCISLTTYTIFQITKIETDSAGNNTFFYTFKYLRKNNEREITDTKHNLKLTYKPGQHFLLRGVDAENRYFTRAYTPIPPTRNEKKEPESFTILVKFYADGLMSKYLRNLNVKSECYWRGPYGNFTINYKLKNCLMICQGTGIAPIFSIISDYVANETCETFIKLFYCCQNMEHIHLRNEIHKLSSYWNFTYEIFLSRNHLSENNLNKKYNETINCRRLDENDLTKYLADKVENFQILICGHETFNENFRNLIINKSIDAEFIHVF